MPENREVFRGGGFTLAPEGEHWRLRSEDGSINVRLTLANGKILRRLLNGGATEEDLEMLRGLTLLDRMRHTESFLRGELSMKELGRILYRRTLRCKRKEYVLAALNWFERNGFKHIPAEIIFKKAIL